MSVRPRTVAVAPLGASGTTSIVETLRQYRTGYLILVPGLLLISALAFAPALYSIALSFQNRDLARAGAIEWVGLANYAAWLADAKFWSAVSISLVFVAAAVTLQVIVGLAVALLFNREFPGREICRALILLPWVLPMVSAANAWLWILNPVYGIVNGALMSAGLIAEPLQWLSSPGSALWTVVLIKVWKAFPFATLLFMAGLSNIPKERYEAAAIDGATARQRFIHVTLPGLRQVLLVVLLLQTIWTFNDITTIYLLTTGGPGDSTTSLPILVYQTAFAAGNLSKGAAGSILMFAIAGAMIFAYVRLYARNEEAARG